MSETGTANTDGQGRETVTDESLLLEHARRLEVNREGRVALHFRLSRLGEHYREDHHIRIAARLFDDLLQRHDSRLYVLSTGDMMLVGKDIPGPALDAVAAKIRNLFRGDPLVALEGSASARRFVTRYDVARDFGSFFSAVREAVSPQARAAAEGTPRADPRPRPRGRALTPELLEALCIEVDRLGFSDLIDRQTAIRVGVGGEGRVLFREVFVSIAKLRQRLAPELDLLSDRWMFQHLTGHLDRRLLATLGREITANPIAEDGDLSVNLNIATVMGNQFQAFDRALGREGRTRMVIELQQLDVFADIGAFLYVRDWLRGRGYRVLIDGLNPLSLRFFDPGLLGADLYKVFWGPEYRDRMNEPARAEVRTLIGAIGRERIIMARVDSEDAVKFGLELGIQLFQGRFIDDLVAAMSAQMGSGKTGKTVRVVS